VPDHAVLLRAELFTNTGMADHEADQPLRLRATLHVGRNPHAVLGLHVYDSQLNQLIQTSSQFAPTPYAPGRTEVTVEVNIPARALNAGTYRCTLVIAEQHVAIFEKLEFALGFTIIDSTFPGPGAAEDWGGYCSPRLPQWHWPT